MHTVSQISTPAARMSATTINRVKDTTTVHGASGTNPGDTETTAGNSTHQSHVKGDSAAFVIPQKLQEKLPEGVERTVSNAFHGTGDQGSSHRK